MPAGRPTTYTPEIAAKVCAHIAGGKSLRSTARVEGMPALSSLTKWLREHEEFSAQYATATAERADHIFEEMLEIANTPIVGEQVTTKQVYSADGVPMAVSEVTKVRREMVEHRKLQIDTRKWILARMAPRKYGDRVTTEVGGIGGGEIIFKTIYEAKPEDVD